MNRPVLALVLALAPAGLVLAQVPRDRAASADDLHDLARLERLSARFDAARASGDTTVIAEVDAAVRRAAARELSESRVETRESLREVRASRREAAASGTADDLRDLRDDRRDANAEDRQRARTRDSLRAWALLEGRYEPKSLERRREILDDLIASARAERARDAAETREDRRERRESRR